MPAVGGNRSLELGADEPHDRLVSDLAREPSQYWIVANVCFVGFRCLNFQKQ